MPDGVSERQAWAHASDANLRAIASGAGQQADSARRELERREREDYRRAPARRTVS